MSFQNIKLKKTYRTPRDKVVTEFFIPLLSQANLYRRAVGFFSSTGLLLISNGISKLISNGGNIQLIASPHLSDEDIEAITKGYEDRTTIVEKALMREFHEPKNIREEERFNLLIKMYLKVVVRIALWASEKFRIPIAEAIQDGNLGLLRAFENFDPNGDYRFSTYAPWYIRQNITREACIINNTIYFPVHIKEQLFEIYDIIFEHLCEKCINDRLCRVLINDVSNKLEIDEEKATMYINYLVPMFSVEELMECSEGNLTDNGEFEIKMLENSENNNAANCLDIALNTLTKREKYVLTLRFGLGIESGRTLEEVGSVLGVTRERIRQIEAKAIRKLRHPSRSKKLVSFIEITEYKNRKIV